MSRFQKTIGVIHRQLNDYELLPSVQKLIQQLSKQLLPSLKDKLTNPEDVHVFRFTKFQDQILENRVKGWVVSNMLEPSHIAVKTSRSIVEPKVFLLNKSFIEFRQMVNDSDEWNKVANYKKLIRLWSVMVDENLVSSLNDNEVGLFVKKVIFMNKTLSNKDKHTLKVQSANTKLFQQILHYKFPISNKELFMLLKLNMVDEIYDIRLQFYEIYTQKDQIPTLEFFHAFLEMNIPSSYMDFRFSNLEFVNRIIKDFIKSNILPDRFMSMLILKAYAKNYMVSEKEEDLVKMKHHLSNILQRFTISSDLINFSIACALNTNDVHTLELMSEIYRETFKSSFKLYETSEDKPEFDYKADRLRFDIRVIDAMLAKVKELKLTQPDNEDDVVGVIHQLKINTAPYYMVKYHLRRNETFTQLRKEEKEALVTENEKLAPLIELYNATKVQIMNKSKVDRLYAKDDDPDTLTVDEQFEAGEFGAKAVELEETERYKETNN